MSYTNGRCFVDSNVLLYPFDVRHIDKQQVSRTLMRNLIQRNNLFLSTQVLQEFSVNMIKILDQDVQLVKLAIQEFSRNHIIVNDVDTIHLALDVQALHRLSFWDSLIVSTASRANCGWLISENMNHGQRIRGVEILNPFL